MLGPLQVVDSGRVVAVGGPRERALLVALALRAGESVGSDGLIDAVWGARPPRSATKLLQNHVLRLRKALGPSAIETRDGGYALVAPPVDVDAQQFEALVHDAREATARSDLDGGIARFAEALALWRGTPGVELVGWAPADAEVARLGELRRRAEEEAIDTRLARGDHADCVADLEVLVAAEPLREQRWGQLMLALYRSGRQADALRAYQRARVTLAEELGIEPGPELRAVEQGVIAQEPALSGAAPSGGVAPLPTGIVTFMLTDVEGSTRLWDEHAHPMELALLRHDEILRAAVVGAGGVLLKSRGEGDSTFSVFARVTDAVAGALTARDALLREPWPDATALSVRFAVHAGEAVERDGDYFGPAVNRAARLRAIATGGQILMSHAVAELVRDHLPDDSDLVELGAKELRDLERPERVFALVEPGRPGRDVVGAVCPYPGLQAFEPEDHERFFGRDALTDVLAAQATANRFLAVAGASGSGKSSLLRAGLVPRLQADARVLVMTPGAHPLADPATGLLRAATADGTPVIVIVDQLEELFTQCADEERRSFLDALVAAVSAPDARVTVVVALRADFYGRCADHPDFAALIADANVLLGPMQPDELRAAIEGPARVSGLRLEPGLADLVLADIADEPGALPLLSHALLETWRRRRGRTLTVNGYRESGSVRGAIARTADATYDSLSPDDQATARDIFVRLTELGDGTEDTRRRVVLHDLAPPERSAAVAAVVDTLADARLVTVDGDGTVEVAHEALIREWPRLRAWLNEDRVGLRMRDQLQDAAKDWSALGRDPGALYRGVRLAGALQWLAEAPRTDLNALERDYIDASEAAHADELQAARAATRRLRVLAVGLGVAFVIALLAGTIAIFQRRDADRLATRATRNATLADAARLSAFARTLPTSQADLALLLGVEGRRLAPSILTDGGLQAALTRTPPGLDRVLRFGVSAEVAAATNDGRLLAAPGADGNVRLFDFRSGQLIRTFAGHNANGAFVAQFNADATWLASGGNDGKVIIWDVASGQPIGPPIVPGGRSVYGYFDPSDATRLVTVGDDRSIGLWDLRDPVRPERIGARFRFAARTTGSDTTVSALSPDGRLLAAGGFTAQHTTVWDTTSHHVLYKLPGAPGRFSPDGTLLTTTSTDRILVWDAVTGAPRGAPLTGFSLVAPSPIFSADGRMLAVGDIGDGTIRVFDFATRRLVGPPMLLHRALPFAITFLPNGRLVTAGADEAALWTLGASVPPSETLLQDRHGVVVAAFGPEAVGVVTVGDDGMRLWDPTTGVARGRLLDGRVHSWYLPAFGLDGNLVAAGDTDGTFTVWDRTSARELSRTATGARGWVSVAWDPRRPVLVTDTAPASPGPTPQTSSVTLWDMTDARHPVRIGTIAPAMRVGLPTYSFSPDGRLLALAAGSAGATTIFDVTTGRTVQVLTTEFGFPQTAFSPDGRTLATVTGEGTGGGVAKLFDTTTWHERATVRLPYIPDGIAFVNGGTRFATTSFAPGTPKAETNARIDLWDTATLQPIGEPFLIPTSEAFLASANADGTQIAIGASNGNASLIDVDPHRWQQTACTIAGRNLTHAEWTEYLPGRPYEQTCPEWPPG